MLSCTFLSSGSSHSHSLEQGLTVQLYVLGIFFELKRGSLFEYIMLLFKINADGVSKKGFAKWTEEFLKWDKAYRESLITRYYLNKNKQIQDFIVIFLEACQAHSALIEDLLLKSHHRCFSQICLLLMRNDDTFEKWSILHWENF